jgi:hypothetical protein
MMKRLLNSNRLYGAIFQKVVILKYNGRHSVCLEGAGIYVKVNFCIFDVDNGTSLYYS